MNEIKRVGKMHSPLGSLRQEVWLLGFNIRHKTIKYISFIVSCDLYLCSLENIFFLPEKKRFKAFSIRAKRKITI